MIAAAVDDDAAGQGGGGKSQEGGDDDEFHKRTPGKKDNQAVGAGCSSTGAGFSSLCGDVCVIWWSGET